MPPATLFRYMALRLIFAICALFVILASLILLVDLIENMRFAGKVADGDFGLAISITLLRVPGLAQALIPFVFLFGSIWTFHQLNRRSELSVMRSAGVSIWKLLGPAALIAALSGLFIITLVDPLSSNLLSYAEQIKDQKEGKAKNFVQLFDDGIWLRQTDAGTKLIINAESFNSQKEALQNIVIWRLSLDNALLERIDAAEAVLSAGTLEMHDVKLKSILNGDSRTAPVYAIPTKLTPQDLRERVAPPETMSIWQLPKYIPLAEAAGLPTVRYHLRFHDLCSTPLKLVAMVLIAGTFSIRPSRLSGSFALLLMSLGAGFALYLLSEISSALGESGLAPVALAAWTPAIIASLTAITALLHLEDG